MTVEPIRDKEKIDQMYSHLYERSPKYAIMLKFGINTGLRISDIISIKVCDLYNANFQYKEYFVLIEKKTGKQRKIKLNNTLREALSNYVSCKSFSFDDYLFPSQKGGHLGRIQAYRMFKRSASELGIENFGTHSLRKTWGYWTYKLSQHNIGLIMDTFNHSSQNVTLRYIGINQDQKDELYALVQL